MQIMKVRNILIVAMLLASRAVYAGDVEIMNAKAVTRNALWNFSVSLKHADTGWDHYADGWRVVNQEGDILGFRTLAHPHEDEQPFTRSLNGIKIPANTSTVYIEAHDKVHGWSKQRHEVTLQNKIISK